MVIVVDDTMLREHFYFGGGVILGFYLEQFSVPLVCRGVYPVYSLYRDLLTIDKVIGFTVFHTSFCNNLELENTVTTVDGVLHWCTVDKILPEGSCHDTAGIVDFPCAHIGDTFDKVAAFFLDLSAWLNFDVVVYIFLRNLHNGIFFQLKSCPLLPFVTDFVQLSKVCPVALDHDTVCIELNYFQPRNVGVEVFSQFQQEQLPGDTHRASHQRVKQVVVLVQ